MKRRLLLTSLLSIIVIAVSLILVYNFNILQGRGKEYPQELPIETYSTSEQLYLEIGSKHIPKAAIEIFDKYNINITVNEEEQRQIKSLEDFFIMGSNIPPETDAYAANPNSFKLIIEGEVENPTIFSYEDLLTKFEMKHMVTELYCMPSLRGVGKFSGPSLYDVIISAKPLDENVKVIFIAGDGYEKGWYNEFTLNTLKEHREDYLLAVAMNGYPLAIEHGYPVRLAFKSEAGSTWVKWIVTIRVVPEDATKSGYSAQLSE